MGVKKSIEIQVTKKEIVALDNDMGAFRCLKCNYDQRQRKDMWQMRKV